MGYEERGPLGGRRLYFGVVSTLALVLGLCVGNFVQPGNGFNVSPATLEHEAVADYARQRRHSAFGFCPAHHPQHGGDAFAKGDILAGAAESILFGLRFSAIVRAATAMELFEGADPAVFGVVKL